MNQTQVSCTGGRFFTSWATREAEEYWSGWPFPLQGIFLTQGSNPGFLHCRQILYCCSHQGSSKYNGSAVTLCDLMDYTVLGILQAKILEWVAFLFSRGSSQPRDLTLVSALQVGFLQAESQGKPKNTGVGSLSILQQSFPPRKIQWMLAIWSLVPLPFLNPACTSGSSQFMYSWSLARRN